MDIIAVILFFFLQHHTVADPDAQGTALFVGHKININLMGLLIFLHHTKLGIGVPGGSKGLPCAADEICVHIINFRDKIIAFQQEHRQIFLTQALHPDDAPLFRVRHREERLRRTDGVLLSGDIFLQGNIFVETVIGFLLRGHPIDIGLACTAGIGNGHSENGFAQLRGKAFQLADAIGFADIAVFIAVHIGSGAAIFLSGAVGKNRWLRDGQPCGIAGDAVLVIKEGPHLTVDLDLIRRNGLPDTVMLRIFLKKADARRGGIFQLCPRRRPCQGIARAAVGIPGIAEIRHPFTLAGLSACADIFQGVPVIGMMGHVQFAIDDGEFHAVHMVAAIAFQRESRKIGPVAGNILQKEGAVIFGQGMPGPEGAKGDRPCRQAKQCPVSFLHFLPLLPRLFYFPYHAESVSRYAAAKSERPH